MPLRCVDDRGASIEAPECTPEQWVALMEEQRIRKHLTMPCCKMQAILKTSKLGTQFFAHKARGDCLWSPETEEHLQLKALALRTARSLGWEAQTEFSGTAPDGEGWIADVLAQRGRERIAVEVQWSGQADEETLRRQRRYTQSGVKGIWLLRQPGFPVSRDLPAACIGGSLQDGLKLLLPKHGRMTRASRSRPGDWFQTFMPEEFLTAVFCGRFHFGIPPNKLSVPLSGRIRFNIDANRDHCSGCGMEVWVVTALRGSAGPYGIELSGERGPRRLAKKYPIVRDNIVSALADSGHGRNIVPTKVGVPQARGVPGITYRCPNCRKRQKMPYSWFMKQQPQETVGTVMLDRALMDSWIGPTGDIPNPCSHWAVWPPESGAPGGTPQPTSEELKATQLLKELKPMNAPGVKWWRDA